jgi:hypothetical protein
MSVDSFPALCLETEDGLDLETTLGAGTVSCIVSANG